MSLHFENIKNFIIEWHILLILLLIILLTISILTFIVIKLKKKKKSYVFFFLLGIFTFIIIIYWATTEEVRFLWLGYLIVYGRDYFITFYQCVWFFVNCIIFAFPNCFLLVITCTPYESYVFAGEYYLALKMCLNDLSFITQYSCQLFFTNLQFILTDGASYRLHSLNTENNKYFFFFNFFLNLWHCDNFMYT